MSTESDCKIKPQERVTAVELNVVALHGRGNPLAILATLIAGTNQMPTRSEQRNTNFVPAFGAV
ncbi:MAG: hypothetical protein KGL39_32380 [Patescibacteria group bacterium]|nr:hypothetical protein [Patescibacteria group bacterium]